MDMKALRLRSGKKVEEIAVELKVAISTVRNWDQKIYAPRMTPVDLQKLMTVYGCSFDELVNAQLEIKNVSTNRTIISSRSTDTCQQMGKGEGIVS